MLKTLKTVGMMLLASSMGSAAYALPASAVADVKVVQQSGACTGVVKDALGETVIGASVIVKGTTNGTITDFDGNFSLSGVNKGDIIVISFVGYITQEIAWNGTPLSVTLKDDTQALEEVVVVGYGTQKKVNVTGSVAMIDSKAIAARPVQNVSQALQGVVPGLNLAVTGSGGDLGSSMSMNIRGTGNLGTGSSASPLVLIDGIEGDLNTVNPNDIENVSVLKDAASASIYGARASFGVILVTTKSGKSGKTNVNYSGNVRFNDPIGTPEVMDSYTFAQYFNRAKANSGQSDMFGPEVMQRIKDYQEGKITATTTPNENEGTWNGWTGGNANEDWFDVFFGNRNPSMEHNLSISGGSEKTQFVLSGSFLDQTGLLSVGEDKMQRYTLNSKISHSITDWLKVTLATKWTREDLDKPTYITNGIFYHNVARKWPNHPAYDPNGNPMNESEVEQVKNGGRTNNQRDYFTNQLNVVIEPIKDWRINLEGSIRTTTRYQHQEYLPVYGYKVNGDAFTIPFWMGDGSISAGTSRVNEYSWKENYYTTNIYSDYFKQFENGHYFKVMAGFNAELYKTRSITGQMDGLDSPLVPTLNTATTNPKASGGYDHNAVAGFFARINWSYKDRYMFEANGRYDGSSRFVGDKRWGFFPSFSAGWNITQEEFFQDIAEKINMGTFKFRASWGQLGNNSTNSWYPFYQTMPIYKNHNWLVNGQNIGYASIPGIVTSNRTWETVETWNAGIDWGFFSNRLTGSFDYFVRYTRDMIGPAPELSNALGTDVPQINNTDMKSYGWELELGWRDQIQDFKYGAKLVLSDDQQEILEYPNESKSLSKYYKGRKLGEIWGFTTVGIAQSDEEMNAHLAKVNQSICGSNWAAGDIMYKDLDGDGKITQGNYREGDSGDWQIIGNNTPRYKFGLTLDAAWKGFDLRAFFQGVLKRDLWLDGTYFWGATGLNSEWQACAYKEHWDFWRPEGDPLGANTDAYYPRAAFNGGKNTHTQTRYLQNGAYLRLKNLQLGYTLPQSLTSKAGMSSVRVYASVDNLFTITSLSSVFDPENTGTYGWGGSGKTYPLSRVFSFGLNVNF